MNTLIKTIYFVRHGESQGNIDRHCRGKNNALTENGEAQVKALAQRFDGIPINIVIETSKIRSKQTAQAINEIKHISVLENDLFLERKGDFEYLAEFKHLSRPELVEAMRKKLDMPEWEAGEQELFHHLQERARKAITYLEQLSHENILVVTHGAYLKFLVFYALLGDSMTEEQAAVLMNGVGIQNTGITIMKFYTEPKKKWKLITWNDKAHIT